MLSSNNNPLPAQRISTPRTRSPLIVLCAAVSLVGCATVNPYYDPSKPHHRPHGFVNSDGTVAQKSRLDLLRWQISRRIDGLPKPPQQFVDGYNFPIAQPRMDVLQSNGSRPTITWLGHATVLLQIGGLNVLTDPQFSERASPFSWIGPKRKVPVPLPLESLPRIDVVVISHSHYDHLDLASVLALSRQPGGSPLFLVPLGIERWMQQQGITDARALDWWEHVELKGVAFHFVPAHHWSARSLTDRNETLWGGWVAKSRDFSFYYAGDTGYSEDFKEIGRRFGGFDVAAIPVGGYEPRWFMQANHVNVEEAVKIHQDVRAKLSISVHWGTFELTDEPLDEPIGRLPTALRAAGVAEQAFILLKHGETIMPPR